MKKSLIIALALMLVLAFATSAMAAQALNGPIGAGNTYLSTTETAYTLPGAGTIGSKVYRVYSASKFTADGKTNYPYEIYLPNEQRPDQYRIHSNYSKNTDACASCHSTHTALNNMLLQWYTAYDTCMACHDGTVTTTYDVARGIVGTVAGIPVPAAGGMFGATGKEVSLSSHNVSGALDNTAAPGGSVINRNTVDSHGTLVPLDWTLEFSCTACHTPHGEGGNARLLKGDVNGQATVEAKRREFNANLSTDPGKGLLANNRGITAEVYLNGINKGTTIKDFVYYYASPITVDDQLVYNVGKGYMLSSSVAVYSSTDNGVSYTKVSSSKYKIDNQLGYTRVIFLSSTPAPTDIVKFSSVPIIKVVMDVKNYLNYNGNTSVAERVYHVSGINQFCGACHTDYNTASFEVYNLKTEEAGAATPAQYNGLSSAPEYETGAYSKAHRHSVGRKGSLLAGIVEGIEFPTNKYGTTDSADTVLTCLGCHVAHGAAQDYWNMTLVNAGVKGASGDAWTTAETVELSGSSALKREPNMGICLNCHNKQTSAIGNAANSSGGAATAFVYPLANTADLGQSGAQFVGSAKCEPCHAETYASYQKTAHSNMVDIIETDAAAQQAWYNKLKSTNSYTYGNDGHDYVELESVGGFTYKFYKEDFVLSVSWNHNTLAAVSTNTGDSLGKLYVIFEEVPFTEAEEYGCISCHNTPKGAATSNWAAFKTGIANKTLENGIQCETSGCHGNGSKHVASPSAKNIKNPGTYPIQAQSGANSCGECHGSKHHQGEFWGGKAQANGYLPGLYPDWNNLREKESALDLTWDPAVDTEMPGWEKLQKAPSAMYSGQIVSCITCHTPHSNEVQDIARDGKTAKTDLQLKMPVRALCNGCHENRLVTQADFDKYLPLKANGMPSHLFNGLGKPTGANYTTAAEWRTGAE